MRRRVLRRAGSVPLLGQIRALPSYSLRSITLKVVPRRFLISRLWILLLLPFANNAFAQTPAGTGPEQEPQSEQQQILDRMRAYADGYVANLPNFLCDQITRQYEAGKRSERWHSGDTLSAQLSFHDGSEERKIEQVNGKPIKPGRRAGRTPLVTEGEFGILLSRVLGPESAAVFTWRGWETLRGKRLAVFDYSVDKQHSTLILRLSDLAKAVIPYRGAVYGDPASGAVWRITDTSSEIPAILATREISTTIDYSELPIGDKSFILPVEATVSLLLEDKKVKNEISFQNYRKFETGSVIRFGSESESEVPPKQ